MLLLTLLACTDRPIVGTTHEVPAHDTAAPGDAPSEDTASPEDTGPTKDTAPPQPEDCADGTDNDADGWIDCYDPDCHDSEACAEDCTDGLDNDRDGRIDCEDGDCFTDAACGEDCTDGLDTDGDGLTDCDDDDCHATEACPLLTVRVTGGTLTRQDRFLSTAWNESYSHTTAGAGYNTYCGTSTRLSVSGSAITGSVVRQTSHATQTCQWSLGQVSAYRWYYWTRTWGHSEFLRTSRSGFASTGDCGLSSGMLPEITTHLQRGTPTFPIDSSRFWYQGKVTLSTSGSHHSTGGDTWSHSSSQGSSAWFRHNERQTWQLELGAGDTISTVIR